MTPSTDNRDPVTGKSLSGPILVCTLLLLAALAYALYDETVLQRPWKAYQKKFAALYSAHLQKLRPRMAAAEAELDSADELRDLNDQLAAAEQTEAPKLREIDSLLRDVRMKLDSLAAPFQDGRAKLAARVWELDHTAPGPARNQRQQDLNRATVAFGPAETEFSRLKTTEAQLLADEQSATLASRDLRRRRDEYRSTHSNTLTQQQLAGLLRTVADSPVAIRQIHVPEAGIVDRCESCHLGIREPVTLTAADMDDNPVFASHPDRALLDLHPPERFGCSLCHNGNGTATSGVAKSHGAGGHWQWPLFARSNAEAGCLQCHTNDRILDHAPTLSLGRDLYQQKGCAACHRHESYDRDADAIAALDNELRGLRVLQLKDQLETEREVTRGDNADDDEAARGHYARSETLRMAVSARDGRIAELNRQVRDRQQDRKDTGPNLKDVRLKLRRQWISVWLQDPPAFRPGTRMPRFRLSDREVRALSAFLWQAALPGPALPPQPRGDAARGRSLFETRGCLACHSVGDTQSETGGTFAANLSRLGEKANYDYLVRWVHNPRERTRPWCPREKRDLGPEDYSRHRLPFTFDLQHDICPNDGALLEVQNKTVMPSLRLSPEDARDVATYLVTLQNANARYPENTAYLDDPGFAQAGRALATRYGCASCHEIGGLEGAPRIGTELTKEASRPLEQLDFGLLARPAKEQNWYNHKGFFEHKLREPDSYDRGRLRNAEDRLRMPAVSLSKTEVDALTTFLLGSVDVPAQGAFRIVPSEFRYNPSGQAKDLREGWWLVTKYNCMGCHDIRPGQKSVLGRLPRYRDADAQEQLPPALHQEGARVNPAWLSRFLANPAEGVRPYLAARMPTFSFSSEEVRTLVKFFEALSREPSPWLPPFSEPLTESERQMARALFSSRATPCLKCHLTGDPRHDRTATAPNFLTAAARLKPAWTARWMLDPQNIAPGTAMPSGLFRRDGARWVFAGEAPAGFRGYSGDHVELLVRYLFQFNAEEQRRLVTLAPR